MLRYRFFIAGIVQGSHQDQQVYDQSYREEIKAVLKESFPNSQIICPMENHPDSVAYSDEKAREVFYHHLNLVRNAHCLIVYLPEASMGTSIEIWEAYQHKTVMVTITQMEWNWVVRLTSDHICKDLENFKTLVRSNILKKNIDKRYSKSV
jgi:hypothetical protein